MAQHVRRVYAYALREDARYIGLDSLSLSCVYSSTNSSIAEYSANVNSYFKNRGNFRFLTENKPQTQHNDGKTNVIFGIEKGVRKWESGILVGTENRQRRIFPRKGGV